MKSGERSLDRMINSLIETCRNEQECFLAASEDVHDPDLRSLLLDFSRQRAAFATELEGCAPPRPQLPREIIDSLDMVNREWIHFQFALSRGNDQNILEECERGEDGALEIYRRALQTELPPDLTTVLQRQLREFQSTHDQVHRLCARE